MATKQQYYTISSNFGFNCKDYKLSYHKLPIGGITIYYQTLIYTDKQSLLVYRQNSNHKMEWENAEMGFLDQEHVFHPFGKGEAYSHKISSLYMQSYDYYSAIYSLGQGYKLDCDDDGLYRHMRLMTKEIGKSIRMHYTPVAATIDLIRTQDDPKIKSVIKNWPADVLKKFKFFEDPTPFPRKEAVSFLKEHPDEFNIDDNLPVVNANTSMNTVWW